MAVKLGDWNPGDPEWHEARARGLGGSEVAAVLGLSPYESRFSLWHRKMGAVGPVDETPEMEWGKRLEPAVASKFADEHPDLPLMSGGTWRHDDRPWQIGNPDRIALPAGTGLEIKTSPYGDGWGESGTEKVPPHVRCQAIWYGTVFDVSSWWVAVLIGGCDYREYLLTWGQAEADQITSAGAEFMASLENAERPDIDAHSATYSAIREMHPDIDATVDVELSRDLALGYVAANQARKAAEAREQQAKSLVADVMGDARRAMWDGYTIATRQARGDGRPYVVIGRTLPEVTTRDEETAA